MLNVGEENTKHFLNFKKRQFKKTKKRARPVLKKYNHKYNQKGIRN